MPFVPSEAVEGWAAYLRAPDRDFRGEHTKRDGILARKYGAGSDSATNQEPGVITG